MSAFAEVFVVFLRLGLTSFGGPIAHLGYFRREIVERRRWLDEHAYASLVGLCQFLPGPTSSQVGMALGLVRAGIPGAFAAFVGFTAPSAALMIAFAWALARFGDVSHAPWVHGLKLAAVVIVAQAVWSMARSLAPDLPRAAFAAAAAALALFLPSSFAQLAAILAAGLVGSIALRDPGALPAVPLRLPRPLSLVALVAFFVLLAGLPLAAKLHPALAVTAAFYDAGALVFGGGHVVLPLLQRAVVDVGWVDRSVFLAGYGAAQAVPGPLFSFAAFLGAELKGPFHGVGGAMLCLGAIYLPSFLLVFGAAPLWHAAQRFAPIRAAVTGINAAVVGILLAALYNPVWLGGVLTLADAAMAAALFALLVWRRLPPVIVVAAAVAYAMIAAMI